MGEPSERSLNTYKDSKTFFIWIKVSGTILLLRALFLTSYGFLFMCFLEIKDNEAKCKSEWWKSSFTVLIDTNIIWTGTIIQQWISWGDIIQGLANKKRKIIYEYILDKFDINESWWCDSYDLNAIINGNDLYKWMKTMATDILRKRPVWVRLKEENDWFPKNILVKFG